VARWDENGNGRWEGPNQEESEWYGYRLRDRRLEMQRGAESCEGGGWESLSDPASVTINGLAFARRGAQVALTLSGASARFPAVSVTLRSVVNTWNQR
jgi:prepilin peptidase dependent protein B